MEKKGASIEYKKEFIRWILKHKSMKHRGSVWLLCHLLEKDELLEHVVFVENAHHCPIAVTMTTTDASGVSFVFYKGALMRTDAEKAFRELRDHQEGNFYIQINFWGKEDSELYQRVVEENVCAPGYEKAKVKTKTKRAKETEAIMNDVITSAIDAYYEPRIDAALDSRDKEEFLRLTQEKMIIRGS